MNKLYTLQKEDIDAIEKELHYKLFEESITYEGSIEARIPSLLEGYILPSKIKQEITQRLLDKIYGLGCIEPYIKNDDVTEIMVNGTDDIFIEKEGRLTKTIDRFADEEELMQVIERIVGMVGKRIDESSPYVDARLKDGSRVNAIIPPLSLNGPTLTIRKFPKTPMTTKRLLELGSLKEAELTYIKEAVKNKKNIIIAGGTGSGKTSLLNALCNHIPADERIITIEDSAEIRLTLPHVVRLECRNANIEGKGEIPMRVLLKNALRMRPDRIIIGEIRSGEALDMLQAMNTGHSGSFTTVHANAPLEALFRLETMALMANVDLPLTAIRKQIIASVDIVIQQTRNIDGSRGISSICEVSKNLTSDTYSIKKKKL